MKGLLIKRYKIDEEPGDAPTGTACDCCNIYGIGKRRFPVFRGDIYHDLLVRFLQPLR